jgi:hypothetical protein
MPMHFKPGLGEATEPTYRIRICQPRLLPGRKEGEIELQYSIYVNGVNDGIGLLGERRENEFRESEIVVSLDSIAAINSIVSIKDAVNNGDVTYQFLKDFAYGLIAVYELGYDIWEPTKLSVAVSPSTLNQLGIEYPAERTKGAGGQIELAALRVEPEGSGSI